MTHSKLVLILWCLLLILNSGGGALAAGRSPSPDGADDGADSSVRAPCPTGAKLSARQVKQRQLAHWANVVARFGAGSAPARAFIPPAELDGAVARAAAQTKAGDDGAAALAPSALSAAELEALTAWAVGGASDGNYGGRGDGEADTATGAAPRLQPYSKGLQMIRLHVHIIDDGKGTGASKLSQAVVDAQVAVLNAAFEPHGFTFALLNTTRTLAPQWGALDTYTSKGDEAQLAMKAALRAGGAADLNLYVTYIKYGVLGYATFPDDYSDKPTDDGVVIRWSTLPGAKEGSSLYGMGDTATHEVGHWLGLYHTFQNGCASSPDKGGDLVADTPAERKPSYDCKRTRNTCRGKRFPGNDPVTNFMDYSPDSCLDRFSAGQAQRMREQWATYRHGQ